MMHEVIRVDIGAKENWNVECVNSVSLLHSNLQPQ